MNVTATSLPEVLLLDPHVLRDDRGFFFESYSERTFGRLGLPTTFVQDNHSRSCRGVLRGIHYQVDKPQGKLVRVVQGEIFDVAVDLRRSSPDFGKWTGARLNDKDHRMIWVPPGFGHGFLVLSETAEVVYKASAFYEPMLERTLLWSDPEVRIEWPLSELDGTELVISSKDRLGATLDSSEVYA